MQRKTLADQQLVQADGFTVDGADAEMPLLVGGIGAEILAAHLAVVDQLGQLIADLDAAGPGVGVLVDADLVERGRIDAVKPVGHIGQLKGAPIPDGRAGGEALARRHSCQNQRRS